MLIRRVFVRTFSVFAMSMVGTPAIAGIYVGVGGSFGGGYDNDEINWNFSEPGSNPYFGDLPSRGPRAGKCDGIVVWTPHPKPDGTVDREDMEPICYGSNTGALPAPPSKEPVFVETQPDVGMEGDPGCNSQNPITNRPVVISDGSKILRESDFESAGQFPLGLKRTHNSKASSSGYFGPGWLSTFDVMLVPKDPASGVPQRMELIRSDGAVFSFLLTGTSPLTWRDAKPGSKAKITMNAVGYDYVGEFGEKAKWNILRQVQSVTNQNGITWTFSYQSNRLDRITHSSGRYIKVSLDSNGRIDAVTDPAGNLYRYAYTGGRLSKVTYPGSGYREYSYASLGSSLTAISGVSVDGVPFAQFAYNNNGTVKESGLVGGIDRSQFTYGANYTDVTTPGGAVVRYTYTVFGGGRKRLSRTDRSGVTGCANGYKTISYDSTTGYISSTVDWDGTSTSYTYQSDGKLLFKKEYPKSGVTGDVQRTTTYDWVPGENRLLKKTYSETGSLSTSLKEVTFEYYPSTSTTPYRLKSRTETNLSPNGINAQARKTSYTYQIAANKLLTQVVVDGPRTDVADLTTYAFNSTGDIASITTATGATISLSSYNALGRPGLITDANGLKTQYQYDSRGRVQFETQVLSSGNRTTEYRYHRLGGIEQVVRPDGSRIVRLYDPAGRIVGTNMNGYQEIELTRDLTGTITKERRISSCPIGQTCTKALLVSYSKSWETDQLGRVVAEVGAGQRTEYSYDNNGNVLQVKQVGAAGATRSRTFTYTGHGQVATVEDAAGLTRIEYDALGLPIAVTDPRGLRTTYLYDGFGNRVQLNSPDTGLTKWTYDSAGNAVSALRADGTSISFSHDPANRLLNVISGTDAISYTYDGCLNGIDRLCTVGRNQSSDAYEYTATGLLSKQVSSVGGNSMTVQHEYDVLGRETRLLYPGGVEAKYEFNDQDQVTSLKSVVNGIESSIASNFVYSQFGPATSFLIGSARSESYTIDLNFRPLTYRSDLSYAYANGFGEVTSINDQVDAGNSSQTYIYDSVGRLQTVLGSVEEGFSFDANGGRESHAWGGMNDDYLPSANSNRIDSVTGARARSFQHDTIGNRQSESGWRGNYSYSYDAIYGGLRTVTSSAGVTSYLVNGFNQRTQKQSTTATVRFLNDRRGPLLYETGNDGSSTGTHYLWLDGRLAAIIRGGTTYVVTSDHIGRPREVLTLAGQSVWRARNRPYGRDVIVDLIGGLNIGFPGQYYDRESGLWHNWNRAYDSTTGRYLQSDPIGLIGGLNTYSYSGANPISYVDPDGLQMVFPSPALMRMASTGATGADIERAMNAPPVAFEKMGYLMGQCVRCAARVIATDAASDLARDGSISVVVGALARYANPEVGIPVSLIWSKWLTSPQRSVYEAYDLSSELGTCAAK